MRPGQERASQGVAWSLTSVVERWIRSRTTVYKGLGHRRRPLPVKRPSMATRALLSDDPQAVVTTSSPPPPSTGSDVAMLSDSEEPSMVADPVPAVFPLIRSAVDLDAIEEDEDNIVIDDSEEDEQDSGSESQEEEDDDDDDDDEDDDDEDDDDDDDDDEDEQEDDVDNDNDDDKGRKNDLEVYNDNSADDEEECKCECERERERNDGDTHNRMALVPVAPGTPRNPYIIDGPSRDFFTGDGTSRWPIDVDMESRVDDLNGILVDLDIPPIGYGLGPVSEQFRRRLLRGSRGLSRRSARSSGDDAHDATRASPGKPGRE